MGRSKVPMLVGLSDCMKTSRRDHSMAEAIRRAVKRASRAVHVSAPWLFAREWLNKPSAVGAVWPSSSQLAKGMAARVPSCGDGLVVELGGGTGAVTQALLERGINPKRLMVIERSPAFVQHL